MLVMRLFEMLVELDLDELGDELDLDELEDELDLDELEDELDLDELGDELDFDELDELELELVEVGPFEAPEAFLPHTESDLSFLYDRTMHSMYSTPSL